MKLYLINGWAMSPTALATLARELQALGPVQIITYQDYIQPTLAASLKQLQAQIPPYSIVLGWSLGGMLALQLSTLQPTHALVCLASNPRFVANENWPHAMSPQDFAAFYQQQIQQPNTNLRHFLRLCYAGEPRLKTQAKAWLDPTLSQKQLLWGLDLLEQVDNRAALSTATPQLHLFAQQDALVPDSAFNALQQNWPHLTTHRLKGCHAFTVSQANQLMLCIHSFLRHLPNEPLI